MADECPELEVLAAFADGLLTSKEQSAVESHLVKCGRCLDIVTFAIKAKSAVPRPPLSKYQKL
jgi:hypothetical protein